MRTSIFFVLALVSSLSASASARELDEGSANTSLSAAPMGSTSASRVARIDRGSKKEPMAPAKYDVAFPVRDHGRVPRDRGAI